MIGEATSLKHLSLGGCDLITDLGLEYLANGNLKHCLETLYLDKCDRITDYGVVALCELPSLKMLHLDFLINITDISLREIGSKCLKMLELSLEGCEKITSVGLQAFSDLHRLSSLTLVSCYKLSWKEVLTELKPYVTLAEKLYKLAVQLVANGSGVGSVKMTYTSSRATDNLDTQLVRAMVAKVSESGEIKVEGRVRDGVPHLTKIGVFEVDECTGLYDKVFRRLYELDSVTRKHVTVHVLYCPNLCHLSQRFPFVDPLTLKGFPSEQNIYKKRFRPRNHITPWIKEIAVKFTSMKELQIHGLVVYGKDLATLATSRGKDLRVLKINKYCRGKWDEGLVYVAK
ncbi:leucine-rich repeat, cysteine-containing subtype protein [Tanacetum coccineum]